MADQAPFLIETQQEFDRYFAGEWPSGASSALAHCDANVVRWYGNALDARYHVPISFIYNVYAALTGLSWLLPPHGDRGQEIVQYTAFLRNIAGSAFAERVRHVRENEEQIDTEKVGPAPDALWESILYIMRESKLVCPATPLYPVDWAGRGIRNLLNVGVGPNGQADGNAGMFDAFIERLKNDMPPNGNGHLPHPYLFFLDREFHLIHHTSVVERARAMAPMRPCWGAEDSVHTRALNELAVQKYLFEYGVTDRAIFQLLQQFLHLTIKTPDTRRFPQEFEVIGYSGEILPSEYAQDWEVLLYKYGNDKLLRLTDFMRDQWRKIHYIIDIACILDAGDEGGSSWQGISKSDHLRSLALLCAHDILFYLRCVPRLSVDLSVSLIRKEGGVVKQWARSARNLYDLIAEECVEFNGPFLLENPGTVGWFRDTSIWNETPADKPLTSVLSAVKRPDTLQLILDGGKDEEKSVLAVLPHHSLIVRVDDAATELFRAVPGRLEVVRRKNPPQPVDNMTAREREVEARTCIVLAVLGAISGIIQEEVVR